MTSFVLYQLIETTPISLVIFGLTQKLFTYQYNVISIREISEIFFRHIFGRSTQFIQSNPRADDRDTTTVATNLRTSINAGTGGV